MPEIAEREPKVISGGRCHFSCSDVGARPVAGARSAPSRPAVSLGPGVVGRRKWSSLPRLETRTKESDTDASTVVSSHGAQ